MPINLPNDFLCTATTAVFDEPSPVDFRHLAQPGLPELLLEQLSVRRFLVTTSIVTSTVSAEHSISFVETLFKVPVSLGGRDFLFPVVTYVDHEYSLVRGYLMGFNKLLTPKRLDADPLTLAFADHDLDFRAEAEDPSTTPQLPAEQDYPMLLWTDYSVGPARSHGFMTLDIDAYCRRQVRSLAAERAVQAVSGRKVAARQLYMIEDTFTIRDVLPALAQETGDLS
ncbi:hypothetical protein [Streptomyces sp. SUK 48]|uniref:hypothetical protein n=1 Tax=Streptomyces sp. SUK 48 TaxID=2582831 RepID=UPI00129ABF2F|nr:hypothetical protein [Streptomyces sp. SUK 48]